MTRILPRSRNWALLYTLELGRRIISVSPMSYVYELTISRISTSFVQAQKDKITSTRCSQNVKTSTETSLHRRSVRMFILPDSSVTEVGENSSGHIIL